MGPHNKVRYFQGFTYSRTLSTHPPGRLTDFREAVMGSALGKLSQSETVCIFAAVKHGRSMTL